MNVAVGGTNGWFPDNVGEKPWLDGSQSELALSPLLFVSEILPKRRDAGLCDEPERVVQDVADERRGSVVDRVRPVLVL